jgi:hypothetical protein
MYVSLLRGGDSNTGEEDAYTGSAFFSFLYSEAIAVNTERSFFINRSSWRAMLKTQNGIGPFLLLQDEQAAT